MTVPLEACMLQQHACTAFSQQQIFCLGALLCIYALSYSASICTQQHSTQQAQCMWITGMYCLAGNQVQQVCRTKH